MYPGVDYSVSIKRINNGPNYQICISRIDDKGNHNYNPFTYNGDETLSLIRTLLFDGYSIVPVV